jgi:hypothetical protein
MISPALTSRFAPADLAILRSSADVGLCADTRLATMHPYYTFEPRPDDPSDYDEQSAFINDHASQFSILLGGNGSGKTIAAAFKTARFVLETPPPRERCPFWIIGEYFDQVCNVAWVGKLSTFIPEQEILDYVWLNSKRMWPRSVILRHPIDRDRPGWILEFKSYEQGLGAMKGDSIGGYWFNEEVPFPIVAEVRMRCRDYASPGWADFTPVENKSPEWPEFYDNWPEGWAFYHLNTLRNTALPEGWFENELRYIPEDLREMRTIGKFTSMQGAVYKEFRKKVHVIDPFRIPRDWFKWRAIDFGYADPFVCLWFARGSDGCIYVYDEHYESQRLLAYHVAAINGRGGGMSELQVKHRAEWDDTQPWYGGTYADHDRQERAELAAKGVGTTPAYKAIHAGIEMVRSRMMLTEQGTEPRIKIFSHCRNLIREIPGYRWMVGTDKKNPKDLPYDVDNHALDAMRYGVASQDMDLHHKGLTTRRIIKDASRHGVLIHGRT